MSTRNDSPGRPHESASQRHVRSGTFPRSTATPTSAAGTATCPEPTSTTQCTRESVHPKPYHGRRQCREVTGLATSRSNAWKNRSPSREPSARRRSQGKIPPASQDEEGEAELAESTRAHQRVKDDASSVRQRPQPPNGTFRRASDAPSLQDSRQDRHAWVQRLAHRSHPDARKDDETSEPASWNLKQHRKPQPNRPVATATPWPHCHAIHQSARMAANATCPGAEPTDLQWDRIQRAPNTTDRTCPP